MRNQFFLNNVKYISNIKEYFNNKFTFLQSLCVDVTTGYKKKKERKIHLQKYRFIFIRPMSKTIQFTKWDFFLMCTYMQMQTLRLWNRSVINYVFQYSWLLKRKF